MTDNANAEIVRNQNEEPLLHSSDNTSNSKHHSCN